MRRTVALVADEVQPIDAGWAVRTPSLPDVWSLNHIRVAAPIEFADAVEVADQRFDALPYRHIVVDHDAASAHPDTRFAAVGWKLEREVVMALARAPEQQPSANPLAGSASSRSAGPSCFTATRATLINIARRPDFPRRHA